MDNDTKNTINEQLEKLPPAIQSAIAAVGLRERFLKIVQDRGLRIDQAGLAEDEMMMVLIGLEHPDQFVDNLIKNVGLERTLASNVATDINDSIFKNVRHLLIEMHEKDRLTEEVLQESITPSPTQTHQTSLARNTPRTLGADLTQAKMNSTFRLPPDNSTTTTAPVATPPPTPKAPVRDGKYVTADPYREPIT